MLSNVNHSDLLINQIQCILTFTVVAVFDKCKWTSDTLDVNNVVEEGWNEMEAIDMIVT